MTPAEQSEKHQSGGCTGHYGLVSGHRYLAASGLAGAAGPVQLSDALEDPLDVTHLGHAEVLKERHPHQAAAAVYHTKIRAPHDLPSGLSSPGE